MPPINEETETAFRRVKRGAELLDKHAPGWHTFNFDWPNTNMWDTKRCLLGTLADKGMIPGAGSYSAALTKLGHSGWGSVVGFCPTTGITGTDLVSLWKKEVEKRRLADATAEELPEEFTLPTITLNPTEQQLLVDMLEVRIHELTEEQSKLKPQYREFINPPIMTTRALLAAVRTAR